MKEDLLYFVWKNHCFPTSLQTTDQQALTIFNTGFRNERAGADFEMVKIQIDGVQWVGNVEIHTKASDWEAHQHHKNEHYQNVILHVVWEADKVIFNAEKKRIPTLELKNYVPPQILEKYKILMRQTAQIPCEKYFPEVPSLLKTNMIDTALVQKLEKKAHKLKDTLIQTQYDWEYTTYTVLMRNFGFANNAEPMEQLAQRLPLKHIQKHTDQPFQVEALLLGMAGFLQDKNNKNEPEYLQKLQKEYQFLAHKYDLSGKELNPLIWQTGRIRPANAPKLRLAQIATLFCQIPHFFSFCLHTEIPEFLKKIQITPSSFWQQNHAAHKLGKESQMNILINTIIPILVLYADEKQEEHYKEKALQMLEQLPKEENSLTKIWLNIGLKPKNAAESQGLIEWYKNFCQPKKCATCKIGAHLLKNTNPL
ncbi:MAG: DUF2851 family protein [Cytophagales bacterium]|nr:MAG: DUF2851 family protein [Cytophagales bacterium]